MAASAPLDEHALVSRIATLSAADVDLATLLDRTRAALASLRAIELRGTAGTKHPFDHDLRAPMTPDRRQAIYDSWTGEVDSIMARLPALPPAAEYEEEATPEPPPADDDEPLVEIPARTDSDAAEGQPS